MNNILRCCLGNGLYTVLNTTNTCISEYLLGIPNYTSKCNTFRSKVIISAIWLAMSEMDVNIVKFICGTFISIKDTWQNALVSRDAQCSLLLSVSRPSCPQATTASLVSQESLHTVPHCPCKQASTRPSKLLLPPTNRISVLLQVATAYIQSNWNTLILWQFINRKVYVKRTFKVTNTVFV